MAIRTLTRRAFLRASALVAAGAVTAACGAPATDEPMPDDEEEMAEPTATPQPEAEEKEAAPPSKYTESPMMTEMVNAGELPPVDDRLPPTPLVLEPENSVGEYSDLMTIVYPGEKSGNWGLYNHGDALLKWNKDFATHRAALAESWEWNDDGTEVTVHIRKGIRWSDGQEFVTVDDWMFWYNDMVLDDRVGAPAPNNFGAKGVLPEMEKVDDYTVKVTWPSPNPLFLRFLSRSAGGNLSSHRQFTPKHYLQDYHPEYNSDATNDDIQELLTLMNDYQWNPEYPKFSPWLVKEVTPQSEKMERNPYFWKVDPDGKQLPYFDTVERRVVQDWSSMMPIILNGETDHCRWTGADPVDYPLLVQGQEDGDYEVMWWPCGDASAAGMIIHYCYEPGTPINDLLWNQQFRQGISHAVNRERINSIVFLDTCKVRQFACPSYGAEYDSPRGQEIYDKWSHNWTEYSPETAEALLDEAGVVDADGDGWRELPNGDPLELIIDVNASAATETQTMELVKEDWEAVGLRTVMNAIDGTLLNQRTENCESMLRYRGGAVSGLIVAASHWVPIQDAGWTICGQPIALYYASNGERGMKPPEGSWIWDLWDAYDAAVAELDEDRRNELTLDAYELHIEHGPTQLGFVGERDVPQIRKNTMRNIPDWGVVCSWAYCNISTLDPEMWWKAV